MGRTFNGNTANFLLASAPWLPLAGQTVFTLAAWVRPAAVGPGAANVFSHCGSFSSFSYAVLGFDATGHAFIAVFQSGSEVRSSSSGALATGAWHHLCGVQSGAGNRLAYLDGVAGTPDTGSPFVPTSTLDTTVAQLNAFGGGGSFGAYNGDAAHICFWDVALSAAEVASLAAGVLPTSIQGAHLLHYAPLAGVASPEPDTTGGRDLSISGTVPAGSDPLIGTPTVTGISPTTGTTAGGTSVTITGSNFTNATAVSFGATAASFSVVSDTQITATSPAKVAGVFDVTVTNSIGTSSTGASDRFTYTAPAAAATTATDGKSY